MPQERGGQSIPMTLADAMSLEAKAADTNNFEDALQRVTGIRVTAPPHAIIGATPSLELGIPNIIYLISSFGWLSSICEEKVHDRDGEGSPVPAGADHGEAGSTQL